ncbi:MAG: DEAD/DEAH box helicase [Candidatus Bathyarchaeota archaeon]|nr:DEAD/DEAH box helicase [Candidatus Bathyarchaeota archaeon]
MKIINLPLPESVKEVVIDSGITELYPPQKEAVKAGVLEGTNLVLASPTASGKTLIAELCALKQILEKKGKVLYLSPLRALASEKFEEFNKYSSIVKINGNPVSVGISTGDFDSVASWLGKFDIIVTTNEKADSLLRHRLDWANDISFVIADEVHLLNDGSRGPTLEVVLARLLHINPQLQVLALSATINNVKEIANWLKAEYVTTDWRPVSLREAVFLDQEILYKDGSTKEIQKKTRNSTINLALASIKAGGQALIFASTRKSSVSLAKKIGDHLVELLSKPLKRSLIQEADKILGAGERTRISDSLAKLIKNGTAFHHAGLVSVQRRFIEALFRQGKIKVLVATPTLAFGVNLPARTVIIHDYRRWTPGYGNYPITILDYKQMAGRAGRPKYDKVGESVLVSKTSDEADFLMENYLLSSPEKIWSKLAVEKIIRSHVLSTIASGYAHTENGVYDFFNRTFYAHQYNIRAIKRIIAKILQYLYDQEMLELYGDNIVATRFGRRVSELYIDPLSGVLIRDSLKQKPLRLTSLSLLHLITQTPDMGPIMRPFSRELDKIAILAEDHKEELFKEVPNPWDDHIAFQEFLGEFKTAMILKNWIEEESEDTLIDRFGIQPGDLYRVIENAKWLLHSTSELSKLSGNKRVLSMALELNERVSKGIKKELLSLVRLEGVGRVRGRILYDKGFRTFNDIKLASFEELKNLPLIGTILAKKLKEQVGSSLTKQELEKLSEGKEWKQESLSEFQPK